MLWYIEGRTESSAPTKASRSSRPQTRKNRIIFLTTCASEKYFSAASVSEGRAQSAAILLAMKSSDFMPAYIAKNRPCTATTASRQKIRLTVANTATTFFSLQPHISK